MEKNKAKQLKNVISALLNTNIEIMQFHLLLDIDEKSKKICRKAIRESKKAIETISHIQHIEILTSLYNSFVYGKENYFVIIAPTINKKALYWDTSEKGFQEFIKLENEAREQAKEKYQKRLEQEQMIKKAKDEGKKVEMVYKDGELTPLVVEEKPN